MNEMFQSDETSLDYSALPETCPYEPDQILDSTFFPGQLEADE